MSRRPPLPLIFVLGALGLGLGLYSSSCDDSALLEQAAKKQDCAVEDLEILSGHKGGKWVRGCGQTCYYSIGLGSAVQKSCK